MNKRKISVTVGIPAHNEGKNIYNLLNSIRSQKENNYKIEKIIVLLDGCIDNTLDEVKKFIDKRLEVIVIPNRIGKAKVLNQLFSLNKSDVLLHLDADIRIVDPYLMSKLMQPFQTKEISIVYGNQRPLKPNSYIEKLAYFGFTTWDEAKKIVGDEKSVRYNCFGSVTSYSKDFLKIYKVPEKNVVVEDTYSFYFAKHKNVKTAFVKNAIVYFRLPGTIYDYLSQMSRYLYSTEDMKNKFDTKLIAKYETINLPIKILAFSSAFLKTSPIVSLGYALLHVSAKIKKIFSVQKTLWIEVRSSKI